MHVFFFVFLVKKKIVSPQKTVGWINRFRENYWKRWLETRNPEKYQKNQMNFMNRKIEQGNKIKKKNKNMRTKGIEETEYLWI